MFSIRKLLGIRTEAEKAREKEMAYRMKVAQARRQTNGIRRKSEDARRLAIEYEKNIPVGTFKLIPLIETAGAIVEIKEIYTACTRVVAVAFGCEDYVTYLGGKHDPDGQSIYYARNAIVNAVRATGVLPIDTVHIKVHDLEDLEKNLVLSKNLGFEGMLVLNPKELPLVNQYFSPSEEEVAWAEEMVQLTAEAKAEGKGVAVKEGKFIGPPMLKMAEQILAKHNKINQN